MSTRQTFNFHTFSWQSINDKHRKKYDKNFVACDESYERDYIIYLVLSTFPYYTRAEVEQAVDLCCKTLPAPRPREQFLQCLQKNLPEI